MLSYVSDEDHGIVGGVRLTSQELQLGHLLLAGYSSAEMGKQMNDAGARYAGTQAVRRDVMALCGKVGLVSPQQFSLHVATSAIDLGDALPVPDLYTPLEEYEAPPEGVRVTIGRQRYATSSPPQFASVVMGSTIEG